MAEAAIADHKPSKWVLKQDHGFHPTARLGEAWRYRLLIAFFASQAFGKLYRRTRLGFLWVPLRPLAPLIVGAAVYGALMKVPSAGVPYFLTLTVGMAAWNCFSGPWAWGSRGLELNRDLISKLYFPRIILPLSTMVPGLVEPIVNIGIAALAVVYYRATMGTWYVHPSARLLIAPLVLLVILFFAFSLSLFTSIYQVRARDVRMTLGYVLGFWMYATPIIYPATQVPAQWRWLMWLNPLAPLAEEFKSVVFDRAAPPAWTLSLALTEIGLAFVLGVWHFHVMESQTVDRS